MVQATIDSILGVIWITMLIFQTENLYDMWVMSCLGGGLRSLSALVSESIPTQTPEED